MRDFFDWLDEWCPLILVGIIKALLFIPRGIVFISLPPNAKFEFHPLHWVYQFLGFEE